MLAYAAHRPFIERRPHPNTLLMIIGAHVGLAALVMSAKLEVDRQKPEPPIIVETIKPIDPPPPAHPIKTRQPTPRTPMESWIDRTVPQVQTHATEVLTVDAGTGSDTGAIEGTGTAKLPELPQVTIVPVRSGARLITPQSELKPPYPASKLLSEEEATLRLKLTVSEQGRVIAVDPLERTDPAFLDAARRHLIAHWRYRPASEDGRAIVSIVFVTLHFELDG